MRVKLLERVVVVVVTHTAHAIDLGASGKREALVVMAIDHLVVEVVGCVVRGRVVNKLTIGVVNQDNQAAELAVVHVATVAHTAQQAVAVVEHLLATLKHLVADQLLGQAAEGCTVGSSAIIGITGDAVASDQTVAVKTGIGVVTCRILDHSVAVDGRQVIEELVTMQLHGQRGTVGLDHLRGRWISGNGACSYAHQ